LTAPPIRIVTVLPIAAPAFGATSRAMFPGMTATARSPVSICRPARRSPRSTRSAGFDALRTDGRVVAAFDDHTERRVELPVHAVDVSDSLELRDGSRR